jgi:hypothetical protein
VRLDLSPLITGEQHRPPIFGGVDQHLYSQTPFRRIAFGDGEPPNIIAGISQCSCRRLPGQRYRLAKWTTPRHKTSPITGFVPGRGPKETAPAGAEGRGRLLVCRLGSAPVDHLRSRLPFLVQFARCSTGGYCDNSIKIAQFIVNRVPDCLHGAARYLRCCKLHEVPKPARLRTEDWTCR